jgi:hypothetical protein
MLPVAVLMLLTATLSFAQSASPASEKRTAASSLVDSLHYSHPKFTNWDSLAQINPSGKLFVITLAQPAHRHSCAVRSFTATELVCKGSFGSVRSYKALEIAALIVPGDFAARVGFAVGFTGATAVVAWRAFVLAATCTACAVGVAIGAFLLFVLDVGTQAADPANDALLYLAPGQNLQVKLRM